MIHPQYCIWWVTIKPVYRYPPAFWKFAIHLLFHFYKRPTCLLFYVKLNQIKKPLLYDKNFEHSIIQKWPSIPACLNVESWALLSTWVDVESLKYDGTIECWALYNLLLYYSLDIIKTSCKKLHAFSELKSCFSTINASVGHATRYFLSGAIGMLKHFPYKLIVITILLYTIWGEV